MKRSTGVTVSAVVVFIGSGLTLLFGALTGLSLLVVRNGPQQPPFVRVIVICTVAVYAATAIWGLVSGVGLLNLREWARISMLVFSGLLLLFTLPALVIIPLLPTSTAENVPAHFFVIIKIVLGFFYGLLAAVGGAWLYFFNKKTVKSQFQEPVAAGTMRSSARPLSITVIGWFLVVCGCVTFPFSFLHFPLFFMSFMLTGWRATLQLLVWSAAYVVAGSGLLRLRPWARILGICVFSFGVLNGVASILIPGAQARFNQAMAFIQSRMNLPATPMPLHFPIWLGSLIGAAVAAAPLWFLITRKQAFFAARESSAPLA